MKRVAAGHGDDATYLSGGEFKLQVSGLLNIKLIDGSHIAMPYHALEDRTLRNGDRLGLQ
ncbi:hypothetical protein GCM10010924_39700 [Rhizobium wenxiniae]|nr:hypothetical protein GCM10010924_39700 [Rhizobium wenxiniae]